MIHVTRGDPPEGFSIRSQNWKSDFDNARKKENNITISKFWPRVRNKIVGDAVALAEAFHSKCAFCESFMEHVTSANIEHYRPKGNPLFEALVFSWDNWLLSCKRCNDKKWVHFPDCSGAPCLIDPTTEDPSEHIGFSRTLALGKTTRGVETIALIGLNRGPLEDERVRWLLHIQLLLLLCLVKETTIIARELLIWCMQVDAPYSAMTRVYLTEKAPLLANAKHSEVYFQDPILRIEELVEKYKDQIGNII